MYIRIFGLIFAAAMMLVFAPASAQTKAKAAEWQQEFDLAGSQTGDERTE